MNKIKMSKDIEICQHKFMPLGFDVYQKNEKSIEAVACVFCEKCSLFRTKILKFIRELSAE